MKNSHGSPVGSAGGGVGGGGRGNSSPSPRGGRQTNKSRQVNDVTDRLSHLKMECSTQLNKCASWLCKRSSSGNGSAGGNLNDRQRSPSVDMIHHHSAAMNASPIGSGGVEDDSQPPARNCYRLIVLG